MDIRFPPVIKRPWISLPDNWDAAWRTARQASDSSPCRIAVLGDSTTQGGSPGANQVTDYQVDTWWALLRTWLLTQHSLGGDFWTPAYSADYITSIGATYRQGTYAPPFNFTDVTGVTRDLGGYGLVYYFTGVNAGTLVFQPKLAAYTDIDLITIDRAAGNFQYSINGAADVQVSPSAGTPSFPLRRQQLTGLAAAATHEITMYKQSATNVLVPIGCAAYVNRNAGLQFTWGAKSAAGLQGMTAGSFPSNQALVWQGWSNTGSLTGFLCPAQPHLAIIAMGINDCGSGFISGFEQALKRLIWAFRRGVDNCSIIIMAMSDPDAVSSDTSGFTAPTQWPRYVAIMQNVAASYHCAFVDVNSWWGELGGTASRPALGTTSAFQSATDGHPTIAGHAHIASILESIL